MAKVYGNNAHNGNAQLKREYEEKMQAWKGPKTISNVITMIGFIGFRLYKNSWGLDTL